MTNTERIQAIVVTLIEAAVVGDLHPERAEAIHDELMKRISIQSDDVIELITERLTEIVNKK